MCNVDNTDSFGGPATPFGGQFRGSPRGPVQPAAPAAIAAPTGLAGITPSARGPRNRRGLER